MTKYFEIREDKIFLLSPEKFLNMTISEIMRGSYLVKHETEGNAVRYVSDDIAHAKSVARGEVRWLHDLFAILVDGSGICVSADILGTKLSFILHRNTVEMAKQVFPGSVELGNGLAHANENKPEPRQGSFL